MFESIWEGVSVASLQVMFGLGWCEIVWVRSLGMGTGMDRINGKLGSTSYEYIYYIDIPRRSPRERFTHSSLQLFITKLIFTIS